MVEKLLSNDAIVSYLSTFVGIIITVVLIPIAISIYTKRKNKHKRLLAEKILMAKLNNHLDLLVPEKFRDNYTDSVWVRNLSRIWRIIEIAYIIPFSIEENSREEMQKYFTRNLKAAKKDMPSRFQTELINTKKDLEMFFFTYEDVIDKKMFRGFYSLDYQIETCEYNFENYDTLSYEIYAETIVAVIDELNKMRELILKKYTLQDLKKVRIVRKD